MCSCRKNHLNIIIIRLVDTMLHDRGWAPGTPMAPWTGPRVSGPRGMEPTI